jgi:hypothetical protein
MSLVQVAHVPYLAKEPSIYSRAAVCLWTSYREQMRVMPLSVPAQGEIERPRAEPKTSARPGEVLLVRRRDASAHG